MVVLGAKQGRRIITRTRDPLPGPPCCLGLVALLTCFRRPLVQTHGEGVGSLDSIRSSWKTNFLDQSPLYSADLWLLHSSERYHTETNLLSH